MTLSLNDAKDFKIVDGRLLSADLKNNQGEYVKASIELNLITGDLNGQCEWDGNPFTKAIQSPEVVLEGGLPYLKATFTSDDGKPSPIRLMLSEKITNDGGKFRVL
ncbi:unnamed protein product [Cunninghamella echinulata]